MSAHQSAEEVFPPSNAETELIERCRVSDEDAWDALFDTYYAAVARFVFQLSTDFSHEDTEEICQETFLSVVRNLESFHEKSSFQTWLFRIATNKAMDFRQNMHAAKRGGNAIHLSLHAGANHNDPPVRVDAVSVAPQ
jgi:DNA-directed RNA polymerase specialized sigma24 family protein